MYNFFVVRITNRIDGTYGNSVKAYENESDAIKEFFRQSGQAVDTTHLTETTQPPASSSSVAWIPPCSVPIQL